MTDNYLTDRLTQIRQTLAKAMVGDFASAAWVEGVVDELSEIESGLEFLLMEIRKKYHELEKEKNKTEAVLANLGEGLIVYDTQERVTIMNSRAEKILGILPGKGIGKKWLRLVKLEDKEGKKIKDKNRPLRLALQNNKRVEAEIRIQNSQGKKINLLHVVAPVKYKDEIVGAVGLLRDISRERELEMAKDDFLAIAAHQLRTPLGIIRWNNNRLGGLVRLPRAKQIVALNNDQIRRLVILVNNLLDVSRINQGRIKANLKIVNLSELLYREIYKFKPELIKAKVKLNIKFKHTVPVNVKIDPDQMIQVIQNLLSNAIKYNKPGGVIGVDLENPATEVFLTVEDNGIGIPKEDENNLFSKFFRTSLAKKKGYEGSGLGLFVVKSYIESWGGTISYTSEERKGTKFIIKLPKP